MRRRWIWESAGHGKKVTILAFGVNKTGCIARSCFYWVRHLLHLDSALVGWVAKMGREIQKKGLQLSFMCCNNSSLMLMISAVRA